MTNMRNSVPTTRLFSRRTPLICAASIALFAATAAPSARAASGTWIAPNTTSLWSNPAAWAGGIVADGTDSTAFFDTLDPVAATLVRLDSARTIGGLVFGDTNPVTASGWTVDNNGNAGNVLTLAVTTGSATITVGSLGAAATAAISAQIAGVNGLTKMGAGTLSLSAANTYTGATAVNAGTLALNFAAAGAPVADILLASSPLQLGGGTISMIGAAGAANTQSFASTAFNAGLNGVSVTPGAGGTAALTLGSMTAALNSIVRFSGAGTITGTPPVVGTGGILGASGNTAINTASGGYATYGLDDFAAASGGNIVAGSTVAGFYQNTYGVNFDMLANTTLANGGAQRAAQVVRWNTPAATTLTGGTSNLVTFTGALITPNMGANNALFNAGAGGVWQIIRNTNPNGAQQATIWQNNTAGFFTVSLPIIDGREGVSDRSNVVKAGAGTVVFSGANTYTGRTSIYEGALSVGADNNLGANATPVSLAGGTLFSTASFTLPATRSVTVTGSGGIAASTGNSLTVASLIGGTGQLVLGSGTLAGTGAGTANPTDVIGNGTVVLTANNFHTGGNKIVGGTANINGINALGGANYGGLILDGGSLQYASTLTSDGDFTVGKGVTLGASNGTIDTNGNSITYAAGLKGAGGLTKTGNGTLNLTAAGTYTGNSIINGGTLKVTAPSGSATGTGSVTVNALGTLAGTGTIGGPVIVNAGGTIAPGLSVGTLTVPALTLGVDSLLNFEFNNTPANDRIIVTGANGLTINGGKFSFFAEGTATPWSTVGNYNLVGFGGTIQGAGLGALSVVNPAAGYSYTFGASGGFLTLAVATSGVISNWAFTGGGNWSDPSKWSNGVPDGIGAVAGLGSAITGNSTVTLDGSRTVGGLTFNNANSYTVAPGSGSLTLQKTSGSADLMAFSGSHTIASPIVLASNVAADISANAALTVSGQISGAKSVTKRGAGVLSLGSANLYTLGTTIEAGTLEIGNSAALGAAPVNISGSSTLRAGAAALAPANSIAIGASVTATVDTQAHTLTVGGVISDTTGNGALSKTGTGTLIVGSANTYGGVTSVNNGVLSTATLADGGLPSGIGQSPAAAASLVLNGGTLRYTGAGASTDRLFTAGTAGATLDASGTDAIVFINPGAVALTGADTPRTITLTGTSGALNSLAATIGDNITGATSLSKTGTGNWIISGTNTFTGDTVIAGGTLVLENALALQGSRLNYDNLGGTLSFGTLTAATLGNLSGAQPLALANDSAGAVALTVGNAQTTTFSGAITDGAAGSSLTKVGGGTLNLTGASTYTGATTVNGGVLTLGTGGTLGTGALQVNANGNFTLNGGTLIANTLSNVANSTAGPATFIISSGSATFNGGLNAVGNQNQNWLISATGGTLTAASVSLGRSALSYTTEPTAGSTTTGFYINGATVAITGALSMSNTNGANSSVSTRLDSGSLTVDGAITIGLNNGGRWSVLDINGGTFTSTDATNGVIVGAPQVGNAEFLVRAGISTVEIIRMGQAASGTSVVNLTGGSLYVGSGGIVQNSTVLATIKLAGGTLGAKADWASTIDMQVTGNPIVQTSDASNVPHDITLGGALSGAGTLTKAGLGKLTLAGAQSYSTLIASEGRTDVSGSFIGGTSTVTVSNNATVNFGADQTLGALDIGDGAVVTIGTPLPPAPPEVAFFAEPAFAEAAAFSGAQAVPEPGSAALLLGGMLTLLGLRRRA